MIEILLITGVYLLCILNTERFNLNKLLMLKAYVSLMCAYLILTYGEEVSQILGMISLLAITLLATILIKTKNDEGC